MALPDCEKQVIDKERDFRVVKSDTHVLSNGLFELQPLRSVRQSLTIGCCYLRFTLVLGVHARHVLHSLPGNHALVMSHGYPLFANVPFFYSQLVHVWGLDSCHSTKSTLMYALASVLYTH